MADKLVNMAKWRLLVWVVVIVIVGINQLWAQQTNSTKQSSQRTAAKTMYVAQQPEATDYSATNTASSEPALNSALTTPPTTKTTSPSSPTPPSSAAPGTISPVPTDQVPEAMTGDVLGVENGLWEGCDAGNCCAICGGGYCTPPSWYTEQGARIISHTAPREVILSNFLIGSLPVQIVSTEPLRTQYTFTQALNSKVINYNSAVGYQAKIGRYLGRDSMDRDDFLEFTYWGMNTWFDSVTIGGQRITDTGLLGQPVTSGNIISNFPNLYNNSVYFSQGLYNIQDVGGFNRADLQTYSVDSEMHNWEMNLWLRPRGRPDQLILHPNGRWRRECRPGTYMSYLVGIRYMTVGEGAFWHSEGIVNYNSLDHPVRGDYIVKTENDLLGFQIGTDLMFRRCKWSWGVQAKVGPYINFARNIQQALTDATGDPLSTVTIDTGRLTARKQNTALIGEIEIVASYKFKPNLTGRASYDFMWISGLALGPEQFQLVSHPLAQINTNGSIYAQGVSLGLEWCW